MNHKYMQKKRSLSRPSLQLMQRRKLVLENSITPMSPSERGQSFLDSKGKFTEKQEGEKIETSVDTENSPNEDMSTVDADSNSMGCTDLPPNQVVDLEALEVRLGETLPHNLHSSAKREPLCMHLTNIAQMPLDWSLKQTLTIYSHNPINILPLHLKSENSFFSTNTNTMTQEGPSSNFIPAISYHEYIGNPRSKELSSAELEEEWLHTIKDLFYSYLRMRDKYFYFITKTFILLFKYSTSGNPIAIMNSPSKGFRSMLEKNDIGYSLLEFENNKAVITNSKNSKSPLSQNTTLPTTTASPDEDIILNSQIFPDFQTSQKLSFFEKSDEKLLVFEKKEVQKILNFVMVNWSIVEKEIRLVSPYVFMNSTYKISTYKSIEYNPQTPNLNPLSKTGEAGNVNATNSPQQKWRMANSTSHDVKYSNKRHKLTISGIILPHNLKILISYLWEQKENGNIDIELENQKHTNLFNSYSEKIGTGASMSGSYGLLEENKINSTSLSIRNIQLHSDKPPTLIFNNVK